MAFGGQAADEAFFKQDEADQAAKAEATDQGPPSLLQRFGRAVGNVTHSMLDGAIHEAEQWGIAAKHVGQDVLAGGATALKNTMDTVDAVGRNPNPNDPSNLPTPVWDHAKQALLDFRDAVQVKDPNLIDKLAQPVAQLAIPFAGYSKALGVFHGAANAVAAGALTDFTALAPHDMRMADLFALGRQTETKLGAALQTLAPDGSALNAYINYLSDRKNETEAEGRFKNVLDGLGVNLVATPLLLAAGSLLKHGQYGIRYMMDNGVRNTISDLAAPMKVGPAAQEGKIVFHGTNADFNEFRDESIGTGEGNQTFGYGHYFAENPVTAGAYAQMRTNTRVTKGDLTQYFKPGEVHNLSNGIKDKILSYDPETGLVTAERTDPQTGNKPYQVSYRDTGADWLRVRQHLQQPTRLPGKQYTVEIPDEHVDNMMHWDKSVDEQPKLKRALKDLDVQIAPTPDGKFRVQVNGKPGPMYLTREAAMADTNLLRGESTGLDAGMAYRQLADILGGQKAASKYLASEGITGIRFLDQGSRQSGEGTRNLVLFDPKKAKIVKKEEK